MTKKKTQTKMASSDEPEFQLSPMEQFEAMLRGAGQPYEWEYDTETGNEVVTVKNYGDSATTTFTFDENGELISVGVY